MENDTMFAVQTQPLHIDGKSYHKFLTKTCDFGGKGSIRNPKVRTWKTRSAAQRFADKLHSSQQASVVEI